MIKKLTFVGMKPKRALKRYVEGEVEKWIAHEQCVVVTEPVNYEVQIEREGEYFHCSIEIALGACRIRAREGGRLLRFALAQALRKARVTTARRAFA